jgi:cobalt-zinc-cadmium efflux system outer membrane protein
MSMKALSRGRLRALFVLGVSLCGGACATVPADSGFGEVRDTVTRHSGDKAVWSEGTSRDAEARTLLAEGLTADRAVEVALFSNHALQASLAQLGVARADLLEAGLIRNPLVAGEIRFPGSPAAPYELSIVQPLMDLLQRPARKKMAEARFEEAKLRAALAVLDAAADTRAAFYTAQGADEVVALRRTLREAAEDSARLVRAQREAGNVTDRELDTEESLADVARFDLDRAERDAALDRERLNRLMGTPGAPWSMEPSLPGLPAKDPPLDGLEGIALASRLDVAEARAEVDWAAHAKPLARLAKMGELNLGVHQERDAQGLTATGPALEISVPIFNRGQAAVMRAEAELREAMERFAALEVLARSEVRTAHARLLASRAAVLYYNDTALPRRRKIANEVQLEYNAMQAGVFDLVRAKQAELVARLDAAGARRDYWLARTELERAVGGRRILEEAPPQPPSSQGGLP